MTEYVTKFGSLADYDKGGIELINDQAKNYAFSNIFEVANSSKPWEKVAVGKNMQYVLEAIRAEGTSEWRTCAHDEFPLCMDGEVTIELVKLDTPRCQPTRKARSTSTASRSAARWAESSCAKATWRCCPPTPPIA